jgi:hypothetical protein
VKQQAFSVYLLHAMTCNMHLLHAVTCPSEKEAVLALQKLAYELTGQDAHMGNTGTWSQVTGTLNQC